jgi:uncharacterized protein YecE (DUF72 family)
MWFESLCDTINWMVTWYLGTMGFGFKDWEGVFYPAGLPPRNYLRHYHKYFNTVELDTTFYGLPKAEQIKRWVNSVPSDFSFSLKMPRQITHELRLQLTNSPMSYLYKELENFGESLGVILVQLPPDFTFQEFEILKTFLDQLSFEWRYAVEFRHASWFRPETAGLLTKLNVCWAATEYLNLPDQITKTTDFLYIRWIGEHGRYERKDHERVNLTNRLEDWLTKINLNLGTVGKVFGYFNNDYAGFSPATCQRFQQLVGFEPMDFKPPQQGTLF